MVYVGTFNLNAGESPNFYKVEAAELSSFLNVSIIIFNKYKNL